MIQLFIDKPIFSIGTVTNGIWMGLRKTDNVFTCSTPVTCSSSEIVWSDQSQFDSTVSTKLTDLSFGTATFTYGTMTLATSTLIIGGSSDSTKEYFCENTCPPVPTCSNPTAPTSGVSYSYNAGDPTSAGSFVV